MKLVLLIGSFALVLFGCKHRTDGASVKGLDGVARVERVGTSDSFNVTCADGSTVLDVPQRALQDPKVQVCKCSNAKCTGQLALTKIFASKLFFGDGAIQE